VSEFAQPKNEVPLESSIPAAPLESILCTEELHRRPARLPDYEKENAALVALVSALTDSPRAILQTLADTILEITLGGTRTGGRFSCAKRGPANVGTTDSASSAWGNVAKLSRKIS